jgi:hypothetical protein
MAAPAGEKSNTFVASNYCKEYGCRFATEAALMTTSPKVLTLDNYDIHAYPLHVSASLVDYYGTVFLSDNLVVLSIEKSDEVHCSINNERVKVVGTTSTSIINGIANFSSFSVICYPSGQLTVTLSTTVRAVAALFPEYSLSLVQANLNKGIVASMNIKSSILVQLRTCRRGEKYDLYSDSRSSCSQCENSYSLRKNTDNSVVAFE